MTYELTQRQHAQEDEDKKKKSVAFKSTTQEEESTGDEDDEDIALITRKFKRFMKRKWKGGKKQEAKDLNTLPLEELLGSLMTYELTQRQHAQDDEDKKKKTVAFKSTSQDDESTDDENEDIALITRKFKRFMKRKWKGGKKQEAKGDFNKESTIICFEYKKPGHIRADCPLLKKKERKEGNRKKSHGCYYME